jgi:hypothetical protein
LTPSRYPAERDPAARPSRSSRGTLHGLIEGGLSVPAALGCSGGRRWPPGRRTAREPGRDVRPSRRRDAAAAA